MDILNHVTRMCFSTGTWFVKTCVHGKWSKGWKKESGSEHDEDSSTL